MTDTRPLVPVIVGPTAVGKTAVAAALARLAPVTVISADARQVYRGLDIGTAKPGADVRALVPHRGVDVADPGEWYSAGRFAREAAGWIAEALAAGRRPVVVGGTGLYVRALADGLFREPPLDAGRREVLRSWTGALPAPDVVRWAARLDARFAGGGRQRAARAIEVALLTGRSLSWWQREARATGPMRPWYIRLTLPRETLRRRIADRVDRMIADGLVDEVRGALARGVPADARGLDGVGYREVVALLQGRLPAAQLRDAILVATRRYAKRQETWFRHQLSAVSNQPSAISHEPSAVSHQPSAVSHQVETVWTLDATAPPDMLAGEILARWQSVRSLADG